MFDNRLRQNNIFSKVYLMKIGQTRCHDFPVDYFMFISFYKNISKCKSIELRYRLTRLKPIEKWSELLIQKSSFAWSSHSWLFLRTFPWYEILHNKLDHISNEETTSPYNDYFGQPISTGPPFNLFLKW